MIGPFVNVFNEGARAFVLRNGVFRIVLPVEAPATSIKVLANTPAEIEVMVFGRQTLSVAMRCYRARSHGLTKDSCQFVCGLDPNGLSATTVTGEDLLTISGTSTQSHGYVMLLNELEALRKMGVTHFRVSPRIWTWSPLRRFIATCWMASSRRRKPKRACCNCRTTSPSSTASITRAKVCPGRSIVPLRFSRSADHALVINVRGFGSYRPGISQARRHVWMAPPLQGFFGAMSCGWVQSWVRRPAFAAP